MRIYIKAEGRKFFIPCPFWILNFAISIVNAPFVQRYIPEKDKKYVNIIDWRLLKKGFYDLKKYRGLKIVDVKAKDGTEVTITI